MRTHREILLQALVIWVSISIFVWLSVDHVVLGDGRNAHAHNSCKVAHRKLRDRWMRWATIAGGIVLIGALFWARIYKEPIHHILFIAGSALLINAAAKGFSMIIVR